MCHLYDIESEYLQTCNFLPPLQRHDNLLDTKFTKHFSVNRIMHKEILRISGMFRQLLDGPMFIMKGRTKLKETLHPTSAKDRQDCFSPRACWGGVGVQVAGVRQFVDVHSPQHHLLPWSRRQTVWRSRYVTPSPQTFQLSAAHNTTQRLYLGTSGTQKKRTTLGFDVCQFRFLGQSCTSVVFNMPLCKNKWCQIYIFGTVSCFEWSVNKNNNSLRWPSLRVLLIVVYRLWASSSFSRLVFRLAEVVSSLRV